MEELKKRKNVRLSRADYNKYGRYFLTVCTSNRRCTLSRIAVGTGVPDGPQEAISTNLVGTGVPDGPQEAIPAK